DVSFLFGWRNEGEITESSRYQRPGLLRALETACRQQVIPQPHSIQGFGLVESLRYPLRSVAA
ncbi:hypothetical protein PFISCL1PPCAC_26668, partial [Pristionchus fissidentatus]